MRTELIKIAAAFLLLAGSSACSDDQPNEEPNPNREAFFPTPSADYTITEDARPSYTITIERNAGETAETITLNSVRDRNIFDIPSEVTFDVGQTEAPVTVNFDIGKLDPDHTYTISFVLNGGPGFPASAMTLDITLKGEKYKPFFAADNLFFEYDEGSEDKCLIKVYRATTNKNKKDEANIYIMDEGGIFSVPATVQFGEGKTEATVEVGFDRAALPVTGETYTSLLYTDSERTEEGFASANFNVTRRASGPYTVVFESEKLQHEVLPGSTGEIQVAVLRSGNDRRYVAELKINDSYGIFSAPSSVEFPEGVMSVQTTVTFDPSEIIASPPGVAHNIYTIKLILPTLEGNAVTQTKIEVFKKE